MPANKATKARRPARPKPSAGRASAAKRTAGKASARKPAKRKVSKLKRPRNPMPPFVRAALRRRGLLGLYKARPDYQQNDYLGWISAAKRADTRQKRLEQMLDELDRGDVYMNMRWSPERLAKRTS